MGYGKRAYLVHNYIFQYTKQLTTKHCGELFNITGVCEFVGCSYWPVDKYDINGLSDSVGSTVLFNAH